MPKVCEWKVIEVGNWYTEYECQICNAKYTTEPEDLINEENFPCFIDLKET